MRTCFLGLTLLLFYVTDSLAAPACGRLMSLYNSRAVNCQCNNEIEHFGYKSPYKNLKLVAICDYREFLWEGGSKEVHGHFFFRGKQTFSGTITLDYNDAMGIELLVFSGDKIAAKAPFFPDFVYLRFEDVKQAVKYFKAPPLTKKHPCLEAEITFTATEILTLPGDSDEAGNYVRGYKSVKIGEYHPCKAAP